MPHSAAATTGAPPTAASAAAPAPLPAIRPAGPRGAVALLVELRAWLLHACRWLLALPLYYLGGVSLYLRWRARRLPQGELRVLRYHRVIPDRDVEPVYRLGVNRSSFAAQMRYLARAHRLVDLEEAGRFLQAKTPGPGMRVMVTLDDGYHDNLTEGLPGLEAAGVPSLIFITTGPVSSGSRFAWERLKRVIDDPRRTELALPGGETLALGSAAWRRRAAFRSIEAAVLSLDPVEREAVLALWEGGRVRDARNDGPLTWDQVRELRDHGVALGAHTVRHPFLTRLDDDDLRHELRESRRHLAAEIEREVPALAYPAGDHDPRVVRSAREAGYSLAFTTRAGSNLPGDDALALRRKGIAGPSAENPWGGFSRALFATEVAGLFDHLLRRSFR